MSRPRVSLDKHCHEAPVRVEYAGSNLHYSEADARDLYEQLGGVLMTLDPPDTLPPTALSPEPDTTPGTAEARRRSSNRLAAVDLSAVGGLAARVDAYLAEGKTPRG